MTEAMAWTEQWNMAEEVFKGQGQYTADIPPTFHVALQQLRVGDASECDIINMIPVFDVNRLGTTDP